MREIIKKGQFGAYRHNGFWQSMDNIRDHEKLESMLNNDEAKWKIWKS